MPIVLVVDDSKVDQHLMGAILEKNVEWLVSYAENGTAALEMMETIHPDIVVTDMLMPEMNGLELVAAAKQKYPHIPMILAAAAGSDDLATQALKLGAASYVSKQRLADSLLETVEQVLRKSDAKRDLAKLLKCTDAITHRLVLPNDPSLINPLVSHLKRLITQLDIGDENDVYRIGVAVEEAVLNSICHGNLELSNKQQAELRHVINEARCQELIRDFCRSETHQARCVHVEYEITSEHITVIVRDGGEGFDTSQIEAETEQASLSEGESRGLVLIGHLMDRVEFNSSGTEIKMVYDFTSEAAPVT